MPPNVLPYVMLPQRGSSFANVAAGMGNTSSISPVVEQGAVPWPNPQAMKARGQTASGYASPYLWLALDNRLFLWGNGGGEKLLGLHSPGDVQYYLEAPYDVTAVAAVPGTNTLLVGTVRGVHWFRLQPPPSRRRTTTTGSDSCAASSRDDTPVRDEQQGAAATTPFGLSSTVTGGLRNRHVDFSINHDDISPVLPSDSQYGYSPASQSAHRGIGGGGGATALDDLTGMFQRKKVRDPASSGVGTQGTATQQAFVDTTSKSGAGGSVSHLWAFTETAIVARFKDGSMCGVLLAGNDISEQYSVKLLHNSIAIGAWNFVRYYRYAATVSVALDHQKQIVFELHGDGAVSARHITDANIGASFQCYTHNNTHEAAQAAKKKGVPAEDAGGVPAIAISAEAGTVTMLLADGSREVLTIHSSSSSTANASCSFKLKRTCSRPNINRMAHGTVFGNASQPSGFHLGPGSYFHSDNGCEIGSGGLTCILDSSTGRVVIALETRPIYLGNEEPCEVIHLGSVSEAVTAVVEVPVSPAPHTPSAFLKKTATARRIVVLGERGILQAYNIASPEMMVLECCQAGCAPVLDVLGRTLRPTTMARALIHSILLDQHLLSRSEIATQLFDQACYPAAATPGGSGSSSTSLFSDLSESDSYPVQLSPAAASLWAVVKQIMDPLCGPSIHAAITAVRTQEKSEVATVSALKYQFKDCIQQCEMVLHVLEGALTKRGWRTSAHCKLDIPLECWHLEEGSEDVVSLHWARLAENHPLIEATQNDRRHVKEEHRIAAQCSFFAHLTSQMLKVRLMVQVLQVAVSCHGSNALTTALPLNLSLWEISCPHSTSDAKFYNLHLSAIVRGIVVYSRNAAEVATIPALLGLPPYTAVSQSGGDVASLHHATLTTTSSSLPKPIVTELRVYEALRQEHFSDALTIATANAAQLFYAESYTHVCNALESAAPEMQAACVPTLRLLACIVKQVQSAGFSAGGSSGGRRSTTGEDLPSRQTTASSVASTASFGNSSIVSRYVPAGYSSSSRRNTGDAKAKAECLELIIGRLDEVADRAENHRIARNQRVEEMGADDALPTATSRSKEKTDDHTNPIFVALSTLFSNLDAYDDGSMLQLLNWVSGNTRYINDETAATWLSVGFGDALHTPGARKVFNKIFQKSDRYLNHNAGGGVLGNSASAAAPDNRRRYIAASWLLEEVNVHQTAREAAAANSGGDTSEAGDTATPTVEELSTPQQEEQQKELAITLLLGVAKSDAPTSLKLRCLAIERAYREVITTVFKEYKRSTFLAEQNDMKRSSSSLSQGDFAAAHTGGTSASAGGGGGTTVGFVPFTTTGTEESAMADEFMLESVVALLPVDHPVGVQRRTLQWQAKMELVVRSAMVNETVNKHEVDILQQHLGRIQEDCLDGVTLFTLARQCRQLGGAEVELMILQHEAAPEELSCIEAVRHAILFHPNQAFSVQDAIVDIVGRFYAKFTGPFPLPFVISLMEGTADTFDPYASVEILHDNAGVPLTALFACYRYLLEESHCTVFHEFQAEEPKMLLLLACITGRMANGSIPSEEWKLSYSFVDSRIKRLLSSSRIGGQQLQPEDTALLHKAQSEMLTCEEAIQYDMQAVGTQRSFIFT